MMYLQPTIYLISLKEYMLPCLNKKLFGVECPGCGMQRSVQLLFQGDFVEAFKMYPAIYPIILLLAFLVSTLFIKFKFADQIKLILMLTTAGAILVSYLIKMNILF
ncbi:DUF2752 domain-containing protein [Muricauda sp. MAR_2010_75]|uniref:DUF2752 domain-containing protein n=1 Tax=Allomuricauda sp. MAR_2010_75 TaxID=1250232 RepID=UPI0029346896|nr:DUF2752 domain-containing protein [Muricauda sp. MAR_2010_75]